MNISNNKTGISVLGWIVAGMWLFSCKQKPVTERQDLDILPFYTSAGFTPQWIEPGTDNYRTIPVIPAFRFLNQLGDTVTEKTFAGKIYVADFFFTSCPGICKKLTTNLLLVQDAFKGDSGVLILSHSVTPELDGVSRLNQYARAYGVLPGKWHLVTGNRDSVYTLARRAYFADEDMGEKKNSQDFLHTENLLLIDQQRRIRGVYKGTSVKEVNDLIADINVLKRER